MIVRKHMSAPPISVSGDTDFKSALFLMQKHRIRRLPVVDAAGVLTGIVAERDLLIAADRYLNAPVEVARFMTRDVATVGTATPVVDAAMLMVERKVGGLPVVDGSRRVLGLITETDLLRALAGILRREQRAARQPVARSAATRRPGVGARPVATASTSKASPKPKTKPAPPRGARKVKPAARTAAKRARAG
jgi:acetoin utilization protein AcuB